ncbi:MAG TPA: Asp23/Gls24 family envelope stress response protein [Clostridiaceae bacterium]|nr:Asp23/Gls24 family envelope stress response protein [Clostridiaceae bacterium]
MKLRGWKKRRKTNNKEQNPPDPKQELASLEAKLNEPDAVSRDKLRRPDPTPRGKKQRTSGTSRQTSINPIGRLAEVVGQLQQNEEVKQSQDLRYELSQIAVVAFVGPSGTGKSTRAIKIARKYQIHYIIDDGLLIHGSRIVAGSSAKRADTRIASVRQALFLDPTRANNMRRALAEHRPATLMILGTSDSMLSKICNNLWLNQPSMLIRIEDVTTEEERQIAKKTRLTAGQHTIPVPSMEIKHEFSGYFSDPMGRLRRRFDREQGIKNVHFDSDRTVVRPTFSSLGNYSMSDQAMENLVKGIVEGSEGVEKMIGFKLQKMTTGVVLYIELALSYGIDAQHILHNAQERVSRQVEEYTAINVLAVDVTARRVVMPAAKSAQ